MKASTRILILDPSVENRPDYQALITGNQTEACVIQVIETIDAALESVRQQRPDCILLDSQLFNTESPNLLMVLSREYGTKVPAIVLLSHQANECIADNTLESGALEILNKSHLSRQSLFEAIDSAIHKAGRQHLLRLRDKALKHLTITDELTGLYDRRYALDQVQKEIRRAERYNIPFGLALVDLDNFRQINQVAGDAVGDQILKDVGLLLRKNTRSLDIVSRFDDDQFLLILPSTKLKQARLLVARIQRQIKTLQFRELGGRKFRLRSSIGLTAYDVRGANEEIMIHDLIKALEQAKNRGGDQICVWPESLSLVVANA